jgi:cytochrome bd ubiquinol oxidase subunit II
VIDPVLLVAVVLVVSLTAYALLGGADYGGGVWDLLAIGPTADRQRATIARAIGPVWEANHVWLILAIVIMFTGVPRAFAALSTYLHIPLLLVLVGIVLRGSAFVFRAYGPADKRHERFWGRIFAVASAATPLFLGVVVGAVTEGNLPESPTGAFTEVFIAPWLTPFSIAVGGFALAMFVYLAAVYLTLEAREADVRAAFRRRALLSGVVVAVVAAAALVLAERTVQRTLLTSPWSVALHVATGACALGTLTFLWRERYQLARVAAAAQVTLILWGWALAQYPYAIRPHLTLAGSAAPENVLVLLLQVLGIGALVLLPSLLYLFAIFGPRGTRAGGSAPHH